jgi:tRNA1(Val) A37 N6-methylase TrmN6
LGQETQAMDIKTVEISNPPYNVENSENKEKLRNE